MTDDVRQRLCTAMRYEGDDWLERAESLLDGEWRMRQRRKVYDVTTVGGRIRAAREALGLSQEQLSIRLSVRPARVSEWERGLGNIDARMFVRLSAVLQRVCTRKWLLEGGEEGAPAVPRDVLGRKHSRSGYAWMRTKEAWRKAQEEADRRNAERKVNGWAAAREKPEGEGAK